MSNSHIIYSNAASLSVRDRMLIVIDSTLLALSIFFASFGKYSDKNAFVPSMNAVFELIFKYGRHISIFCLMLILLMHLLRSNKRVSINASLSNVLLNFYWLLQFYFLFKMLIFGNVEIFYLGVAAILTQIFVLHLYITSSEKYVFDAGNSSLSSIDMSICIFAALFATVNVIAYLFYPESSSTYYGRYFGTMVNPNHFMMTAILTLPALLTNLRKQNKISIISVILFLAVCVLLFFIYQTGSRTGLVTMLVVIGVAYRDIFLGSRLLIALFVLVIILLLIGGEIYTVLGGDVVARYIEGREDTRTEYWVRDLNLFIENPLFGVEPNNEGRLELGLNLWLALMTNGGIIGLVFAIFILIYLVKMIGKIWGQDSKNRDTVNRKNMFLAALISIFTLSMFESVFMGLYTSMAMLCIVYFAGSHVFSMNNKKKHLQKVNY